MAPRPQALCGAELAEILRQGAKAAARGDGADTNPLDRPHNQPLATGECAARWRLRSAAWARGHQFQVATTRRGYGARPMPMEPNRP